MKHWKTVSATGIIGGIVSTDALNRRPADRLNWYRMPTLKPWPLIIRPDVHQLITAAATERGINPSYLVETILIQWLNANILKQPITRTEPPQGGKLAYRIGQLAAIEKELYNTVSINSYLFETTGQLSALRKQLKRDKLLSTEIQELFKNKSLFTNGNLVSSNYPWFFAGLFSLPPDFLGAVKPRPAQLPPDGTAQLTTDPPGTETIKRRGTTPWRLNFGEDVRTAMKFAATQLTYTITGLVETVLIDWLNRNYLADHTEERNAVPTESRQSYIAGQLARIELDQFGEVSLDAYLRDAGASLGSLKPRLRKAKQLTRATETLFREVRLTDFVIKPAHRFWFFAGFSQLSFDFLAAKHSRGEIPRN